MLLLLSDEGLELPSLIDALLKGEVVFLRGAGISAPSSAAEASSLMFG